MDIQYQIFCHKKSGELCIREKASNESDQDELDELGLVHVPLEEIGIQKQDWDVLMLVENSVNNLISHLSVWPVLQSVIQFVQNDKARIFKAQEHKRARASYYLLDINPSKKIRNVHRDASHELKDGYLRLDFRGSIEGTCLDLIINLNPAPKSRSFFECLTEVSYQLHTYINR